MKMNDDSWQIPKHNLIELKERASKYCVCIPVINEGERIRNQLQRMAEVAKGIDIIIADGGSTDGSLELDFLKSMGVKALLVKTDKGKLSAQLRMGFAYAIREGYEGIVTVDGNNKDSMESIPDFIKELESSADFVQGSRHVPGGQAINTPLIRRLAIKLIHVPVISMLSGFKYSDTTNGFRGHSRRLLLDPRVQPFRDLFDTYELLAYLSVKAPRMGYKVKEIPVIRKYPKTGKTPTKISPLKGNITLLKILLNLALKKYDVKCYVSPITHNREEIE
ncbi:glycosyltransferase family 2 protein [Effusibacillus dendaii]|uniref:Glycosyl transferase family 2 n=1 Tax=Effusibacillus dendaii TaxID=2743772 RepID=A0A7I8DC93_9BACL|nr:glycosyltransferase family 2 protein [Effusibacillus dendaii]BCJ87793.1 glycosyl transferase family 2 [Effusibacillus dendaii]